MGNAFQPVRAVPGGDPEFMSRAVVAARRFHLDLSVWTGPGLRVASGGCETVGTDYRIDRPGFRWQAVEFVAGGRGEVRWRGRRDGRRAGALFAYGPRVPHVIESDAAQPLVKYFVNFSGALGRELVRSGPLASGGVVYTAEPQAVLELFDRIISHGRSAAPHAARECALFTELLLLKIDESARPGMRGDAEAFSTYRRCRGVAERRFAELRSGHELAQACHLDEAYLCRLFRRFGEESPYRFLVRLKTRRAAELLLDPGMLVRNAGEAVGFPDPAHFSRVFKRVHGIAPEGFRRAGA